MGNEQERPSRLGIEKEMEGDKRWKRLGHTQSVSFDNHVLTI
jgi:hypothetical protein